MKKSNIPIQTKCFSDHDEEIMLSKVREFINKDSTYVISIQERTVWHYAEPHDGYCGPLHFVTVFYRERAEDEFSEGVLLS